MGFAVAVEAATRIEMTDKELKQRKAIKKTIGKGQRRKKITVKSRDNKKARSEGNNSINYEYKSIQLLATTADVRVTLLRNAIEN